MDEFSSLITEIGFDKNKVIGTNLVIKFTGVNGISEYINDSSLRIEQIKTGDVLSIPFEFSEENEEIDISYTTLQGESVQIQINEINGIGNFVLHHYWYRKIIKMIKDLNQIHDRTEKLEKLNQVETLSTEDNVGDFLREIKDMIEMTKRMINHRENLNHYNTYSSNVERLHSFSSPIVSDAYRSYSSH
jgi:hypothetical protein